MTYSPRSIRQSSEKGPIECAGGHAYPGQNDRVTAARMKARSEESADDSSLGLSAVHSTLTEPTTKLR